ncbi:hypothetical protein GRI36_13620 [Altererythrobacter gangjinensis]|uniref:TonB C-terminal domain-containing protein n=2 Tax=Pontixanthobacter gangjinensis TaxID=1028742 RepID=A0A6I4SS24_9SPHN|nr:hypothetical protein [Pontixanthobacter gangjinensis]
MADTTRFSNIKRKPKASTIILIVLLHILAIYGLARAFAPGAMESVERSVVSVFEVTITTPEEEPPVNEPVPDEGASGEEGKKAVPKPTSAPETIIKRDKPMPKATSTGKANTSGAKDQGEGSGGAGSGDGTGSGRGGDGMGSGAATKAEKISGDISRASDYPIPEGGRKARVGTSVSIAITVGTDGVPKSCRVFRPGPFPETNVRTCELAMQRFRFKPATNRNGDAIESVFGWKQDFFN